MILFYTGAIKTGQEQKNPALSLGGYISSSIVPNGLVDNLFPDIGLSDLKNNQDQIKVIALQNITGTDLNNFQIYFSSDSNSFCKIQLGVVAPMLGGDCNCSYFETLQNQYCIPYYATFADYDVNAPFIYNQNFTQPFANGSYLGLFLKRSLISANNPDIGGVASDCTTIYNNWLATQTSSSPPAPKTSDDLSMIITW